jgi:hypothetical protein
VLAALAILGLSGLLRNAYFPLVFRAGLFAFSVFAAIRPTEALVASAFVGPFSNLLAELLGSPPFRGYEAVTLAFLAGWLLRPPLHDRDEPSRCLRLPALLMMSTVVASIVTLELQLHTADAAYFWKTAADLRDAYLWTGDIAGIIAGANVIEGVLILVAVVELTGGASGVAVSLIRMMAITGAVATGLSLLLAAGVALPSTLARQAAFGKARYAVPISDVNAAGSYYVLLLGLAAGMAASTVGRRQRWWFASLVATVLGLGLSGSRSALAAALIVIAAAGTWLALGRRWRGSLSAGWMIVVLLAVIAAAIFMRSPLLAGSDMRRDFTITSIRLIEARPVFGSGVGRYYALSRLALTPWLASTYGEENAHNYFLQTCAELGVAGLIVLTWLIVTALRPAIAALRDSSRDYVSAGLLAGALAYLITCVSGHPLLLRESAFPFWTVLALVLVTSRTPLPAPPRSRIVTAAGLLACVLVFVSIPYRLDMVRVRLDASHQGFGPWLFDRDGKRYRESGEYSSLFVGPHVTGLELPLRRVPGLSGHRLTVVDQVPTWAQHRTPVTDSWSLVRITLPGGDPLMPYQRVNLSVFDGEGSPKNSRASGVAVGDINITSIRE